MIVSPKRLLRLPCVLATGVFSVLPLSLSTSQQAPAPQAEPIPVAEPVEEPPALDPLNLPLIKPAGNPPAPAPSPEEDLDDLPMAEPVDEEGMDENLPEVEVPDALPGAEVVPEFRPDPSLLKMGSGGVQQSETPLTEEEEQRLINSAGVISDTVAPTIRSVPRRLPGTTPSNATQQLPTLRASHHTLSNARTVSIRVPAPRGQILDRNGVSLAQNKVVYFAAIKFPFYQDPDANAILNFVRDKLQRINAKLGTTYTLGSAPGDTLDPAYVLKYYENRRWLPMIASPILTEEQSNKLKKEPVDGVVLHGNYLRHYPLKSFAPHLIGHVKRIRELPQTPLGDGDPINEETEGAGGLEQYFNEDLTGKAGQITYLFDTDGTKISEERVSAPIPGNDLVTTINADYQAISEGALKRYAPRGGAFVIVDVRNGDVLSMASWPQYDPNAFVPYISSEEYTKLREDPLNPMFPRTFMGAYPPASTFKLITALAALESETITPKSYFSCPGSYRVGNRDFRNWHAKSEGSLNVVGAIMRSCNTFFYQVALKTGSTPLTTISSRFGFGQPTGVPLPSESRGFIPTDEYMMQTSGHKLLAGDLCNMAIGQGRVLCTPLQAAQAMAGIARGDSLPQLRLVQQIQNYNNDIIQHFPPSDRNVLNINPVNLKAVKMGMVAVVSSGGGTGKKAAIKQAQIAGKTGTAQWNIRQKRNLAWFTGFVPADNPIFAYAALYEGGRGEGVSGGDKAAPMVSYVFREVFNKTSLKDLREAEGGSGLAEADLTEEDLKPVKSTTRQKNSGETKAASAPPPPAADEKKPGGVRGFFRKMFGKDKNE